MDNSLSFSEQKPKTSVLRIRGVHDGDEQLSGQYSYAYGDDFLFWFFFAVRSLVSGLLQCEVI